jgi:hypothetical protein
MNETNLKDMWNKAVNVHPGSDYESTAIEQFISSSSGSVTEKVKKMLQLDIGLKLLVAFVLVIDTLIYLNTQTVVLICLTGILLLVPLLLFEFSVLKRFTMVADSSKNTKEKLSGMLTFLRSRFFTALLSISSTYIFIFISGILLYFHAVYGFVRPLNDLDIFVFSVLIIAGIIFKFLINNSQVKYYIKHLELCLTDMDDNIFAIVSDKIEAERKKDRTTKMLVGMVLIFAFVLLIVVSKNIGF